MRSYLLCHYGERVDLLGGVARNRSNLTLKYGCRGAHQLRPAQDSDAAVFPILTSHRKAARLYGRNRTVRIPSYHC